MTSKIRLIHIGKPHYYLRILWVILTLHINSTGIKLCIALCYKSFFCIKKIVLTYVAYVSRLLETI